MTKHVLTFSVVCGFLLMATQTVATAQPHASKARADTLSNIQAAITKSIGAQTNTVEVTARGDVLIVARVNSNMNDATHEGRNNEAKEIASAVTKSVAEISKSMKMSTIRVDYIVRAAAASAAGKVIDSVEFRKGPDGVFDFHQS
jgi:hypothetical protein